MSSSNPAPIVVSPVCFVVRSCQNKPMPPSFFLAVCTTCAQKNTAYMTGKELAAAVLRNNLTRQVSCPRCKRPGAENELSAIDNWSRDPNKKSTGLLTAVPPIKVPPGPADKPVMEQLLEARDGKRTIENVKGIPSAMAQLQNELAFEMLDFLLSLKPALKAADMIRLGLTSEMLFGQPNSWKIILLNEYCRPTDLLNLNGNFTRMLIAGMPEDLFHACKIDTTGLTIIRFNRHAVDCAGWSGDTWKKFAPTTDVEACFSSFCTETCKFCNFKH